MHPQLEKLVELDRIETTCDATQPAANDHALKPRTRALRSEISAEMLAHYDRLKARGRRGVAPVINGICQACHLRLSTSAAVRLRDKTAIHLCDNCSCYLYPCRAPAADPTSPATRKKPRPPRRDSQIPGDAAVQLA